MMADIAIPNTTVTTSDNEDYIDDDNDHSITESLTKRAYKLLPFSYYVLLFVILMYKKENPG